MISKTEPPAAPRARVRRMSRRVMDALAIVTLLLFRDHSSCQDSAIEEGFLPTRSEPSVSSVEMTGKNRALRSMSEVAFLGFVEKIVGSAPGKRHDRERGILVRVGDQRRAIGNKQIFHFVGLAVAVEHGSFRVGAHARGADFVNDFSARLNSERIVAADRRLRLVLAAESFHDGAERFLHVLCLAEFVLRPPEVEAEHGNAPLVHDLGIDLAVGVRIGKHLAAAGKTDAGAVNLPRALLERGAVAFLVVAQAVEHADAGHAAAAPEFDVVAAWEIVLAVEFPPRNVHVHSAHAVVIVRRDFFQLREKTPAVAANRIGKISSDGAGGVGEAVGKSRRSGIEEQARGFAGAGGNDDGARVHALFRERGFVDVGDAFGLAVFVDEDFAGHRAGDERELSGFHGGRKQDLAGTEVGRGDAAAAALAAVVTGQAAVQRTSDDGEARRYADDVELVAGFLDDQFGAARLGWREEDAIGRTGHVFFGSENADVGFHFVVIRREILVGDGPIVAEAIARAGFEVNGGKPQRDAPPVVGAPSDDAGAKPLKIGAGRGSVRLAVDGPRAVGGQKLAEIIARVTSDSRAAVRKFVRPRQHLEIFCGIYVRASFQQDAVEAALGENLCGHAAARAGANDADVVRYRRTLYLSHGEECPYHSPFFIAETAKSPARRAPHPRVNSRRRMLCPQQFVAYVFEDVGSALDPDFARENGVLILDAEYAFVADVHVGLDDGLPNAGAVTVADGAKSFRSLVEVAGFKSEIEDAILVYVLRKENRVFHVGMEEGALLAEKMDDLDGIAALPEEVAEIAVRANLLADSFAKFHQRARVVNHKIRSHFKGEPGDAVSTRERRRFLPIRNHLFFPLPVLHPSILGGPAIRDPVGLGIQRRSARAAGKANNNFHAEHLREEDGLAEGGNVFLGVSGIRVKRVAMTTERGDANTAIFKFFLPSCGFAAVAQELVEWTMMFIGIATRANLHGFKSQRANFIEHGIEREMLVNRVENADGDLE